MSAPFWTLMLVSLNTPQAAVEIRQLPDTPAFQTKASCEDFAKLKSLQGAVCFLGGAPLIRSGEADPKEAARANIYWQDSPWGSAKP